VGLKDREYKKWIEVAGESSDLDFMPEDYADLGIPTSVRAEECWGALLTEICRVRQDPVKSLIKASLVAYHHCCQEQEGLLCETIKQGILKPESDGESPDPSVVGFESAIRFYENIRDNDGLDLIRLCVYLRLTGYPVPRPPGDSDPRRDLLMRSLRKWSWTTEQGDRIEAYAQWTEEERLDLEGRILKGLWSLFDRVAQVKEGPEQTAEIGSPDLPALRRRAEGLLASQPGKIPYASAYLRARRDPFSVHVALQKDSSGADRWAAYDRPSQGPRVDEASLFADAQLPCILGWIVLNGLYKTERTSVVFHHVQSPIVVRRAEGFLKDLHGFFGREASVNDLGSDPAWAKLLAVLDAGLGPAQSGLTSVVFLIQDTWGEMYSLSLDLAHVENNLLRCYEIAKQVCQHRGEDKAGNFEYRIYHSRTAEDTQATKQIEEFIGSFRNDDSGDAV
jgi:adenylate cyclase